MLRMLEKDDPGLIWYGGICLNGDLRLLAEGGYIDPSMVPKYCWGCKDMWDKTCPRFAGTLYDSRRNKNGRELYL